jgi:general secretion pathway protein F
MSSPSGSQPPRVTLEDLAALNREMSALVRTGLPLEAGLRQVADDFSGGASSLAARLADETSAGKTLAEAIAAQGDSLPPVYKAVVDAGLKSGRLAAALEGFADTAARMASLRQIAGQAVIYPVMVAIVAWLMLLVIASIAGQGYESLEIRDSFWINALRLPGSIALPLAIAVPVVLVAAVLLWWRSSATMDTSDSSGGVMRWLRRSPGGRRAAKLSGYANFADLLHMLLSCRVPLDEALPMAAHASGAVELEQPASELAAQVAAGGALESQLPALRRLPPLVRTALLTGVTEAGLLTGLQRASSIYRERAAAWIADVTVLLPMAITVALGLCVVGVYALLILHPYFTTLHHLSHWGWR